MKYSWAFFLVFTLVGCNLFTQTTKQEPIARVNDTYLFQEDIIGLVPPLVSKEDSILLVQNFINQWATNQLLIDKATVNIPQVQLEQYNKLVSDYKNSLLTEAYKNILVSKSFDSTVTENSLNTLYERDKENFLLQDQLVKVRFIQIDETNTNVTIIKDKLNRFNTKDKQELMEMSLQFKNFNLDDSTWVKRETLLNNVKILKDKFATISKNQLTKIEDSTGVYFVYLEAVLDKNDVAPLSFIKPTIKQIVLNKRKLELIKKIEQEITKDARANNDFEIYTQN